MTTIRTREERQDAARLLLTKPLIVGATHPDELQLVRRHRDELTEDFRRLLGYRLVLEGSFARLYKGGLGRGRGRPLLRRSGAPVTPRTYAYLAITCAVLLTSRSQLLLSGLVDEVRTAAAEAGVELGNNSWSDRQAFVAALRHLVAWGVIEEDDGSVDGFASDPETEALLFVNRDIVRHLLAMPLRDVASPGHLVDQAAATSAVGGARHTVRRKLTEEAAVLADDLNPDEWSWLRQYQRREAKILEEAFGLELEVRAEGVAAIDPEGRLSDITFPGTGTLGQAALLTSAELARRLSPTTLPPPRDGVIASVDIPEGLVAEVVIDLLAEHGARWRNDYKEHPENLVSDVTDLLVAMGLVWRQGDSLRLRAVAARYRPQVSATQPAQPRLVDLPVLPDSRAC